MLLTIFNVYQLCSHLLSTTSRTEETGFFPKTEKEASHSSVSSAFSSAPECSDHSPTRRGWDATYQLSPLVKVLLLSSSFFSTASSSTAVCSKSAETESWGEKEASCEEMTLRDCRVPSLCGENSPRAAPSPTAHLELSAVMPDVWAQLAQLPQHVQVCSSRLSTPCALHVQTLSWLAQQVHSSTVICLVAGRLDLTHHLHLTLYHIPQLPESRFQEVFSPGQGHIWNQKLIILLHLTTCSSCKYKHSSLHFSIVTATQTLLLVLV